MEALNIDNLKKKYGDENEEDKAKREKQLGIGASVNLGMSIAMIILGVWYDSEDKTGDATDFLKVGGAVLCVNSAMKVVSFMTPCKCDDKITAIMSPLLDIAYFIVVIWGSVHVFGAYSEWTYEDQAAATYCPRLPFAWAFATLICFWILLPFMCVFYCLQSCCKACAKISPPSENV